MKTFKVLSLVLVCVFFNTVNAQTGPGGVGNTTNNALWLKGDHGTSNTINGQPISFWNDASGNSNNASQGNANQQPLFANSVMNDYPSILFDFSQTSGQNDFLWGADAPNLDNTDGLTIFSVVRPTNTGSARSIISKRNNVGVNQSYMLFFFNSNYYYVDLVSTNNRFNTSPVAFNANTNYMISTLYDGTLPTTSRVNVYHGETLITTASESSATIPDYNSPFTIGATHIGDNRGFGGYISEVIVFRKALNTAERIIVNNYLAAKYDIPISNNDLYSRDNPGNGNFDHHVAGIGQADDGSNHTDSQGTGIVRISNPTSLSNNEYLFWGEETRNPTYNFSTNTSTFTEQLNSRWHVNTQGNLGTVTVSFDISAIDLTGKQPCSELQLVVDNNYDFSTPENVYPLTIVGTTASATGVTINNNRYFTLRYADQIVWDGSSFYNGSGLGNAPNTTNACLKLTVKPGAAANLTFNAHVRAIEVETGGTLNVLDGVLLETENEVVINGVIDLIGEAQLIQNHTGSILNSGTGYLAIRQQGSTNMFNYNYWSAPVNRNGNWQIGYLEDTTGALNFSNALNPNPATIPITLSNQWLYSFNGLSGNYFDWSKLSATSNIPPGIGYTMKGSGASTPEQEYIFKGIPNDGNYSIPVLANTDILIGNPYPSALNADQFINDNLAVIDGSLHFWESFSTNNSHFLTNTEGGYATYNLMMSLPAVADASGLTSGSGSALKPAPTPYINIGQGFFTSILNSGSLIFNNSQRAFARESVNETVYYKTNPKNSKTKTSDSRSKIWFSFTGPKGHSKIIGLGYDSRTTYDFDKGYDAKSYNTLKNDLYWMLDNESLSIQALPEINIQDRLPLGIKIFDAGIYTFSIHKYENIPSDLNFYLVDNFQNIYYDLRDADAQIFLSSETLENQYSIAFQEDAILETDSVDFKTFFTFYRSNTKTLELFFKEDFNEIVEQLTIYSLVGQEVLTIKSPKSNKIDLSDISDGVYILKLDTKTSKVNNNIKFVKY
ncbi:LamG-like jellyroll fold domain-containing protein [Yeosuana sp. AK3]